MIQHLVILAATLLAGGPASLFQEPAGEQEAPYIERTQKQFVFFPGGRVELTLGVAGNVRIVGWQRPAVVVEMEKIVYGMPQEKAKALLSEFPIRVKWTQSAATVLAPAAVPKNPSPKLVTPAIEINITMYVPKQRTDLKLLIVKGDLAVEDLAGWTEATLREGSMEMRGISGYFSGLTDAGDIEADMLGKRWDGYGFTAVTQRGKVLVRLPEEYSAALQLETRDGALSVVYPEQLVDGESVPLTAVTNKNARSLSATVGSGGAPIKLVTMKGEARLESKPSQ
ncbi:MAG: hypothetical protein H6Q06_180 [Acidobacteria bacterium]|jgi:hypothetical protein|nr:hypothetical protein [Acidobacteriota bacterium]